jgi:hypothetical protein
MRAYLVILIILSTTAIASSARAETVRGRVLNITRTPDPGIILILEVTEPRSLKDQVITVHSTTLAADVQLNSRLSVELNLEQQIDNAADNNSKPFFEAKNIQPTNNNSNSFSTGSDKTGVRARMMQASHNSSSSRGSGRRSR